ncbi:hypothetical protein [Planctomycetes bacterium TBK1r]|uniref:Uncharacterized protein n=1 Tax=Stieleria magnilauensis TaxID=2527963 RepID=A0ABX5Y2S5_9BACT|nr:hypothetical protein TBK1r_76170 [Planctomycetes bacterium TBK1r]
MPTESLPAATSTKIEIGVVAAGPFDEIDREAMQQAVLMTQEELKQRFPAFLFQFFSVRRPELSAGSRVEPSVLLQQATEDRDAKHWDFVFVITASELIGIYSSFCFAALSRPLDAAVISVSLVDPQAAGVDLSAQARIDQIALRVSRLMQHSLAHLLGLPRDDRPDHLLYHPATAKDLDVMGLVDDDQTARQAEALAEVADQRLEEGSGRAMSNSMFAIRATWINRREIAQAIWAARAWQFPRRLSRLTLASVSTVAVLLMTAEAWDLALSQSWARVHGLGVFALLATTVYVITRQQLLLRRSQTRSEQSVVTAASAFGIVLMGMAVTWLALFLLGAIVGLFLFDAPLIASWAASSQLAGSDVTFADYVQMAVFSGSVGLLIGALGASFESQNYFRHVIFVDEEI